MPSLLSYEDVAMTGGQQDPTDTFNVSHGEPGHDLLEKVHGVFSGPESRFVKSAKGWSKEFAKISFLRLLETLPIPVVGADRSHNVRFVNAVSRSMTPDFEKLLGTDVCSLFRRKEDVDGFRVLLENAFDHRGSQIKQIELQIGQIALQIGTRTLQSRMHLRSLDLDDEQFVLLFLEDLSTEGKLCLVTEVCKNLVQVFPGEVALFELRKPCHIYTQMREICRSLMSAKLTDCNLNFVRMHSLESFADLRSATFSEFVPEGSPSHSAFTKWIDRNLALFCEIIAEPSAKAAQSCTAVTLIANTRNDAIESFWMVNRNIDDTWIAEIIGTGARNRFDALFDNVEESVFILNNGMRYLAANSAGKALLGLGSEDVVGRTPRDLWGYAPGTLMTNTIFSALTGKRSEETTTCQIQGKRVRLHFTRLPIRDSAEALGEVMEIVRKISDQYGLNDSIPTSERGSVPNRNPICRSEAMRRAADAAKEIARSDVTVLLTGETGTGKNLIAEFIHKNSPRCNGPFIQVNCATIPKELAEAELFGYEQGAFTGASRRKCGLIELAEGGTLFMDEIGELPLALQAKVLTFFDTGSFMRVGGVKRLSADARVLTATNRDLVEEVATGHFREDLFYRLNVLSIRIPPLRERKEDLPDLVEDILSELAETNNHRCVPRLYQSMIAELERYHWPGNVRELRSVLQRSLVLSQGPTLSLVLPDRNESAEEWRFVMSFPEGRPLNDVLDDLKRSLIKEALRRAHGKRQEAAALLGISRSALKHHMKSQRCLDD
jgi:PAS domain S-box-containing protein